LPVSAKPATAVSVILNLAITLQLAAQPPNGPNGPTGPQFEVAAVRIADPGVNFVAITGGPGSNDPGRIRYTHVPMIYLLQRAYGVAADQISGPSWIRDFSGPDQYEITAMMPPDTTKEQFQLMMQDLLAERFHLAVHHETRKFSGYVLSVGKGGSKLTESTPDPNYVAPRLGSGIRFSEDGILQLTPTRGATVVIGKGVAHSGYREVSMERLALDLGFMVNRSIGADTTFSVPRVIDRTGLTGIYDFTLDYECLSCQSMAEIRLGTAAVPEASEPQTGFPNIFTALEKQLGLKLEKAADVPVDVIVIERVEKVPAPN
jgi:uncharacterized protein (TIGR03435 family)